MTKTTIQIKSRFLDKVLFEFECTTVKECVVEAVKKRAYLRGANLRGANLEGADLVEADLRGAYLVEADLGGAYLRGANLRGANLRGANLGWANLRGAYLVEADLRGAYLVEADLGGAYLVEADLGGANLRGANLGWANLRGANLEGADLGWANLRGANLRGANLEGADLRGADLEPIRKDFIAEIIKLPNEISALRAALINGKIDGSTYKGECACLAGTLSKLTNKPYDKLPNRFMVDSESPRERFALAIKTGDTPENNPVSKLFVEWIDETLEIIDNIRRTAHEMLEEKEKS